MSRKTIVPYFPAPPREYNQGYFAQIIRSFAVYAQQIQNPGDGRFTTVTITNPPTTPIGQEDGAVWVRNGQLYITPGNGGVPVEKLTDFTVVDSDRWLIVNKAGSSCVVTLPTASTNTGRELGLKNFQAQTVVSASSNVLAISSGTPGTAILPATVGSWVTLVSNGTYWVTMARG